MNQQLDNPCYAAKPRSFFKAISVCMKKFFTLEGRASCSEFWMFTLFCMLIGWGAGLLLIPQWAVFTRRLHDVGHSGWWWLISFTGIGILVLFYWCVKEGDPEQNKWDKT